MVRDLLYKSKAPSSKKRYVGIEIEFLIPQTSANKLEKLLLEEELQWNVNLGNDGSVLDLEFVPKTVVKKDTFGYEYVHTLNAKDRREGREIRILAEETEAPEIINKVCAILSKCDAFVNSTCGLHVHLDMRYRDKDKVYNNFYKLQNIMFKMQPDDRKNNKFCKRLKRLMKISDKDNGRDRHYGINKEAYAEHRTLEIRMHEGTIDAKEIRKWTYFLINVANMEDTLDVSYRSVDKLKLNDKVKGYINERLTKYA